MGFFFGNFITAYGIPSPKVNNLNPTDNKDKNEGAEKVCAHCGTVVGIEEKVCKKCGKDLNYIVENSAE